jgi:hypothetical protein
LSTTTKWTTPSEYITQVLIQKHPKDLIDLYEDNGKTFEILHAYKDRANPKTDSHKKWMDNVKAKTKFEAVVKITKKAYLGAAEGIASLQQRILKLTQHLYNSKTNKIWNFYQYSN